ncbi:lasso peptide biosynthesis B2 protein [Arundinibacter roseus]|uniref:Lasso peptide biosynthesis B2 protein n=1 Tax=Arundinibacter roseus TaxID=2070510 RepID=A0A4R4K6G9_9BACT|nr:lasso peptide biosynthesis B2 protein [Arundinibacter roseus]TDB61799.1 lasso peptide biosynthesis B2 protein [Arundinibacter roseus]
MIYVGRIRQVSLTGLKMSRRQKFLVLLTFGLSAWSYVLFRFFNQYAHFGSRTKNQENVPVDVFLLADIRMALRLTARYVPWLNVCRHQAYQARLLCRWHGLPYRISVGFKKEADGSVYGHAWTEVGNQQITGFCNPEEYVVQTVYS